MKEVYFASGYVNPATFDNPTRDLLVRRYLWIREHTDEVADILRGMQTHDENEFDTAVDGRMGESR